MDDEGLFITASILLGLHLEASGLWMLKWLVWKRGSTACYRRSNNEGMKGVFVMEEGSTACYRRSNNEGMKGVFVMLG